MAVPFAFLSATYESSNCSASWPTLGIVHHLNFSHSSVYTVIPHCGFIDCWLMVMAVFLCTYLPFICVHICFLFCGGGLLVFLLSSKSSVYILDISLLSNTCFAKISSLLCALPFFLIDLTTMTAYYGYFSALCLSHLIITITDTPQLCQCVSHPYHIYI